MSSSFFANINDIPDAIPTSAAEAAAAAAAASAAYAEELAAIVEQQAQIQTRIVTATSDTVSSTDRAGKVYTTNSSAVTVTLPDDFEVGFTVVYRQVGGGQITFSPSTYSTIVSISGYTKTAGQYAAVVLEVIENSDGNSAVWAIDGAGA